MSAHVDRLIDQASISLWPKPWQNLQAFRATELTREYPEDVAAAWLGHSVAVGEEHYWQVTDADFVKAVTTTVVRATDVPYLCQQGTELSRKQNSDT